jgi:hypothetical protein
MDKREAGKQKAEEFVARLAQSLNLDAAAYRLLWWPEIPGEPAGAGRPNDTTMPLRVYKGNSWRSIGLAGSDVDGSVDDPELLKKYESEVAQCLTEL